MRNLILASLMLLAVGCGGNGGVNVKGKATLTDGTPLTKGIVSMTNTAGSYSGNISATGDFLVEGVPSGDYKVSLTGTGKAAPTLGMPGKNGKYEQVKADSPGIELNSKYSNPDQSGLTLKVPSSTYELKVEPAAGGAKK